MPQICRQLSHIPGLCCGLGWQVDGRGTSIMPACCASVRILTTLPRMERAVGTAARAALCFLPGSRLRGPPHPCQLSSNPRSKAEAGAAHLSPLSLDETFEVRELVLPVALQGVPAMAAVLPPPSLAKASRGGQGPARHGSGSLAVRWGGKDGSLAGDRALPQCPDGPQNRI